jgi:hypothetical protein
MLLPRLRATEIAAGVGLVGAGALVLFGLYPPPPWRTSPTMVFIGLFVALVGQLELRSLRRRDALERRARRPAVEVLLPDEVPPLAVPPLTVTVFEWDPVAGVWRRSPVASGR